MSGYVFKKMNLAAPANEFFRDAVQRIVGYEDTLARLDGALAASNLSDKLMVARARASLKLCRRYPTAVYTPYLLAAIEYIVADHQVETEASRLKQTVLDQVLMTFGLTRLLELEIKRVG